MATLTVQTIDDGGIVPAYAAVNASDQFIDDGASRTYLEVVNDDASPTTVTVPAVQTSVNVPGAGDLAIPNIQVTVAAGTRQKIGPFQPAYRNASGYVTANYSNTTSVTAGAFKLAKEA